MKHAAFLCTFALLAPMAIPGQPTTSPTAPPLAERLEILIAAHPVTSRAHVGVMVTTAETGEVLFALNEKKLFTPASNAKLFSSACALETWGPDKTFRTALAIDSTSERGGEVVEGAVNIVTEGDPVFSSDDLTALVVNLKENSTLERAPYPSRVYVWDDGPAGDARALYGPGWMWDDFPYAFSMAVDTMMMDYNVMNVEMRFSGARPVARAVPNTYFPTISTVGAGGMDCEDNCIPTAVMSDDGEEVLIRLVPSRSQNAERVPGQTWRESLTVQDPHRWITGVLQAMLAESGVRTVAYGNTNRRASIADPGEIVAEHVSPPLSEILARFNKPSENAIGEMLLLNLAHAAGRERTWSAGGAVMRDWLTSTVGLESGSFRLVDGSGLSRYNLITAEGTVRLLDYMWDSPHRDAYVDSLPIAATDGTLSGRMAGTPAQGTVRAKTGTMSGVSCLSGYVIPEDGEALIFSVLVNGYVGSSAPARDLQDQVAVELAIQQGN